MGRIKKNEGKKTIPEVSEITLHLQDFIEKVSAGEQLSYERIEQETEIQMNQLNKAHLRTACRRAKREYSCIYGYGIKLADVQSVMPILVHRLSKIDRTVRRGEKSQKILQEQFFHSLNETEQKNILFIGACFGAIRVAAENGKHLFGREIPKQISSSINIPYDSR